MAPGAGAVLLVLLLGGALCFPRAGAAREGEEELRSPRQLTTHPAAEFQPRLSPDGGRMLFVSDREGDRDIYLKELRGPLRGREFRLTFHPARDTSPAWSPDGRTMAWVSSREDARGDIYLMELPGEGAPAPAGEPSLRRLTGREAADKDPAFSPDSRSIVFAASGPGGFDLWLLDLGTGRRERLVRGAEQPAFSPDGRLLLFVRHEEKGGARASRIWALRLGDRRERPLTPEGALDGFPAFARDGRSIYFARFRDDTNRDGRLDARDNPSIWRLSLPADPLGGELPVAEQLTPSDYHAIFPEPMGEGVAFAADLRAGFDLWWLPAEGTVPLRKDAEAQWAFALSLSGRGEVSAYGKILAFLKAGRVDLPGVAPAPPRRAEAGYRAGEVYREAGDFLGARRAFREVGERFGDVPRWAGLSALRLAALALEEARGRRLSPAELGRGVEAVREAARRYPDPRVKAFSLLIEGDLRRAGGEGLAALALYERVEREHPSERALAAGAVLRRGEIYEGLGDRENVRRSYLGLIRRFPDQAPEREEAIRRLLEGALAGATGRERVERLRALADRNRDLPALAAAAEVRIGEAFLSEDKPGPAGEAFRGVIERYPGEAEALAAARFGLARVYDRQGEYARVLSLYREVAEAARGGELFRRARRQLVLGAIRKGEAELRGRDPALAAKTLRGAMEVDYEELALHRGYVRALVARGEAEGAVAFYREEVAKRPGSPAAHYSLGLALTYLKEIPFDEAIRHVEDSLSFNARLSFAHQTLGWLFEQKEALGGEAGYFERALSAYRLALLLNDEAAFPENQAALLLNVGNGYYLLKNYDKARQFYRQRVERREAFDDPSQELVFRVRYGESAFRTERYAEAEEQFRRARDLARERKDLPLQALIADKLGLCYQEQRKFREAVAAFSESLDLNRALRHLDNQAVALRNIANNLFRLSEVEGGEGGGEALGRALDFYFRSLESLQHRREREAEPAIRLQVALGGEVSLPQPFDRRSEERLLYTYVGRIYKDLRDYPRAVEFLEKKLSLLPPGEAGEIERSILLNQVGALRHHMGRGGEALAAFRQSLSRCGPIGSLHCAVVNAANIGTLVALGGEFPEGEVRAAVADQERALRLLEEEAGRLSEYGPILWNNLGVLRFRLALAEGARDRVASPEEAIRRSLRALEGDLLELRRAEEAFRKALASLAPGPGRGEQEARLRANLAQVLALLGKRKRGEAREELEKAEALARREGPASLGWQLSLVRASLEPAEGRDRSREAAQMEAAARAVDALPPGALGLGEVATGRIREELYRRLIQLLADRGTSQGWEAAFFYADRLKSIPYVALHWDRPWRFADRREQEMYEEFRQAAAALQQAAKDSPSPAALRERRAQLEEAERLIREELPDLHRLLRPRAFPPADLQPYLSADSALLQYLFVEGGLLAWRLDAAGFEGRMVALGEREREALAAAARGEIDGVAAAARLLLSPFAPALSGKRRLFVVADGVLSSLPWASLPLGEGPLAARFQVSLLPSASYLELAHRRRTIYKRSLLLAAPKGWESYFEGAILPAFRGTGIVSERAEGEEGLLRSLPESNLLQVAFPLEVNPASPGDSFVKFAEHGRLPLVRVMGLRAQGQVAVLSRLSAAPEGALAAAAAAWMRAGFSSVLLNANPYDRAYDERFMGEFYRALASHPPGEALRRAQMALREARPDRVDWARYLLFGHPGLNEQEVREFADLNWREELARGARAFAQKGWAQAAQHLQNALTNMVALGERRGLDQVTRSLALAFRQQGDLRAAVRYEEKYAELAREARRTRELALSNLSLGVDRAKLGEVDRAAAHFAEAARLFEGMGDLPRAGESLASLGVARENAGQYPEALRSFEGARALYARAGQGRGEGHQLRRLGRIHYLRLNNYAEAEKLFRRARELFARLGEREQLAESLLELGLVAERRANFGEALGFYAEGERLARALASKPLLARATIYRAHTRWFQGDYQAAFGGQKEGLRLAEEARDLPAQVWAHNLLGLIYWSLNDLPRARASLGRSLELARRAGERLDVASAHNNLGLIERQEGRHQAAIEFFLQALAVDREIGSRWGMAYDFRNLGIAYRELGQTEKALGYLRDSLSLSRAIGNRINEVKALAHLGDALLQGGKVEEAEKNFEEAISLATQLHIPEALWRAAWGRGRARRIRGDLKGAEADLRRAVEVVEEMRAAIKIEELRAGFAENKQDLYEDLIRLLLDGGRGAEGFHFNERARARNFIDLLGSQRVSLKDAVSEELYGRYGAMKGRLDAAAEALGLARAAGAPEAEQRALEREFNTLKEAHRDLLIELKAKHPELSSFVSVEPMKLEEVQGLLPEGVALLEFLAGREELVSWFVSRREVRVRRVPVKKGRLEALVGRYRKLLQDLAPVEELSRELYRLLLAPWEEELRGVRRLGIVPHGPLHYLSFASLRGPGGHLVERFPLFYTPSASALRFTLAAKVRERPPRILAVGNPDVADPRYDLPFAEKEVGSLRWSFPNVDVLTRREARKSWIVKNIGQYGVIHFASHGEFDPVNPLFSNLKLAGDEPGEARTGDPWAPRGGELRVNEIFSLDIRADLVVLSACQTGLGSLEAGDDIVGFNRAFTYAGTRSILSTLWRVSDLTTALLVKHFYRELGSRDKAESLREAQLRVMREYPHPAYWAGFVLTGDYR